MKKVYVLIVCFTAYCCVFGQTAVTRHHINLEAFSRAFGIIRYYSPNPYTEKWTDQAWVKVCYNMLDSLSASKEELPVALKKVFNDLAPDVTFSYKPESGFIPVDGGKYYYWEHTGSGTINIPALLKVIMPKYASYKPYYITYKEAAGEAGSPEKGKKYSYVIADRNAGYNADSNPNTNADNESDCKIKSNVNSDGEGDSNSFGGSDGHKLYINIPHALPGNRFDKIATENLYKQSEIKFNKMFGSAEAKETGKKYNVMLENLNFRLANEIVRWNIIRHFYPYYKEDNLDWDRQLGAMISLISNYGDVYGYYRDISKYMNPVKDSHMKIYPSLYPPGVIARTLPDFNVPVALENMEGKVVVTAVAPKYKTNLSRGCVITKVNGIDVRELIDSKRQYYNASTKDYQTNYITGTLLRGKKRDSVIVVEYLSPGNVSGTDSLVASSSQSYYNETQGEFIREVSDGIFYVNPTLYKEASYNKFKKRVPELQSARGIIFDIRGYPVYDFEKILSHFIREKVSSPRYLVPVSCFPCRENLTYKNTTETLEPIAPYLSAPVVWLTNANAISWGETVMMLVKGYKLGTVIGSPTCGTNGDVTEFWLPLFPFPMTGLKALNTDGAPHHGIGVLPDIEVRPTYQGFLEGRDELLEAAIDYLSKR
ncbi:MAG: S41 family peptidase [Bacteroidales bacterium]|nr:S41 family peptidase [Bacteroidales bacterium]MDD3989678.1 S41 family peptidase [Bacteroidales bacterium]MDD4638228.1 S41 family peptidase [Bacteroidales bacterium]